MAALTCLVYNHLPKWEEALAAFYHQFEDDPLVVDKWFTAAGDLSAAGHPGQDVRELMEHPAFTMRNPNRVRALIGAFAHGNPARSMICPGPAMPSSPTGSSNSTRSTRRWRPAWSLP